MRLSDLLGEGVLPKREVGAFQFGEVGSPQAGDRNWKVHGGDDPVPGFWDIVAAGGHGGII